MTLRIYDFQERVEAVREFASNGDLDGARQLREQLYRDLTRTVAWGRVRGDEAKEMAQAVCRVEHIEELDGPVEDEEANAS